MQEYIKKYIEQGFFIFPCNNDKSPMTSNGFYGALNDYETVSKQFYKDDLLIGFPTGEKNGILVIDIDINKDGDTRTVEELKEDLENLIGEPLPETFQVETQNNGRHFYYKMPEGINLRSGTRVFDKSLSIDAKIEGGYVIAPDGKKYTIYDDVDDQGIDNLLSRCAELPQVYIDALQKRTQTSNPENLPDLILPPEEIRQIRSALSFISSDERDTWLKVAMALKDTQSPAAFGIWDEWSQTSEKYNPKDQKPRWDGLKPKDITIASIFHMAKENGWESMRGVNNPLQSNETTLPDLAKVKSMQVEFKKKPFPTEYLRPDGLVGDMIDYILLKSIKPQPIFALSAALCAVGALAGRKFQTQTGTRTNIYCLNVGASGCGKEAPRKALKSIFRAADCESMASVEDLSSDSAIISALENTESQIFLLDEIGRFIENTKTGPTYFKKIIDVLMRIFGNSDQKFNGKNYADQKNQITIEQPNLCLLGTTVPDSLYKGLTVENITDGFLSRMLIFETDNNRPRKERNKDLLAKPPKHLVDQVKYLHKKPINMNSTGNLSSLMLPDPQVVPLTEGAAELLDEFDYNTADYIDELVSQGKFDTVYVRTAQLAEQIALILAIGINPDNPIMTEKEIMYGIGVAKFLSDQMSYIAENYVARNEIEHEHKRVLNIIRSVGCASSGYIARNTQHLQSFTRVSIIENLLASKQIRSHTVINKGFEEIVYTALEDDSSVLGLV